MGLIEARVEQAEVIGGPNFDARRAMQAIDEIITEVYLPFRGAEGYGTERAILVEPPHVPHRENDAEHSWSIAFAAMVLYDMRQELGLELPEDFDVNLSVAKAVVHDVPEIHARDVDAMTRDPNLLALKGTREQAAFNYFVNNLPNLRGIMMRWQQYEQKDTAEDLFVSDIDKIFATRVIFLDGGKKWHGWEGYQTSREDNAVRIRAKLRTDMGHQLFDCLQEDIANNPHVFPYHDSIEGEYQLAFDIPSLTQVSS